MLKLVERIKFHGFWRVFSDSAAFRFVAGWAVYFATGIFILLALWGLAAIVSYRQSLWH